MRLARQAIRLAGGADAVNSFTRFYLALLGQISYDHCPAVPPELMLLAKLVADQHLPHVGLVADDHRAAVDHVGPSAAAEIASERGISELFLREPDDWPPLRCPGLAQEQGWFSWDHFFRRADADA